MTRFPSESWLKLKQQESSPALLSLWDSACDNQESGEGFGKASAFCARRWGGTSTCSSSALLDRFWASSTRSKAKIFTGEAAEQIPFSLQPSFGVKGDGLEFSLSFSPANNTELAKARAGTQCSGLVTIPWCFPRVECDSCTSWLWLFHLPPLPFPTAFPLKAAARVRKINHKTPQ